MGHRRLNDVFPRQTCINLDRRPDRWERMRERFARHDIGPVERFSAVDGQQVTLPQGWTLSAGAYACMQSHQAVLRMAQSRRLPDILIFEDDVDFDPEFQQKFSDYIEQLPNDWDLLLFGGIHQDEPVRVSENIYRLAYSNSTHAYVLRSSIYDAFIDLNDRAPDAIDKNVSILQQRFNCYCFIPHIAWVAPDYSDTRQRYVNQGWLKESLILSGRMMERALEDTVFILSCDSAGKSEAWRRGVEFIINYYGTDFPQSSALIVEQDDEPRLNPASLPSNFSYRAISRGGPAHRSDAFNLGVEMFKDKGIFVFADSDVYIAPRDIKANVMMSRRFDFVSSFEHIYNLTTEDSEGLLNGKRRFDFPRYEAQQAALCTGCCILTRDAVQSVGGWYKAQPVESEDEMQSMKVQQNLSVFESPNPAMRLFNEAS